MIFPEDASPRVRAALRHVTDRSAGPPLDPGLRITLKPEGAGTAYSGEVGERR
ncbi:hypothetical protein WJ438_02665 [Streptomyces sp. GD-15H]|uniref:hypothetical protein n=1 Tax=Streptomyces sp. GD-15H TaxID=3129112 RepID=UPI0032435B59